MPGAAAPPLRSSSSAHVRWRCPPRRPWREGGGGEGGGGRGEGGGGSGAGGRRGRQRRRRQGQRRKRPVTGGTRGAPAPTCSVEREREWASSTATMSANSSPPQAQRPRPRHHRHTPRCPSTPRRKGSLASSSSLYTAEDEVAPRGGREGGRRQGGWAMDAA